MAALFSLHTDIDADQAGNQVVRLPPTMERYEDWTYGLSIAATLILSIGAICILVFAM